MTGRDLARHVARSPHKERGVRNDTSRCELTLYKGMIHAHARSTLRDGWEEYDERMLEYEGKDYMLRVELYLAHLEARGRKPNTIGGYRIKLGRCLYALEQAGAVTAPEAIGEDELYLLVRTLKVSDNTVRDYLTILGFFCKWATGRDPYKEADMLWSRNECRRVFIDPGILGALMAVGNSCDRVILLMGSHMGLRRTEICEARISDLSNGRLRVYGKGHGKGKLAYVRVPPVVQNAINVWMDERAKMDREDLTDGRIVANAYHRGKLEPFKPEALNHRMGTLCKWAGVTATPHSLRRLFATELHEKGVDLFDIKTLMRHENVKTTIDCYIQPNRSRLDSIVDGLEIV